MCYRTFYHAPQADIIAHTMRTSFRRKADKRRYCVGVAVADDGVGDVAVGLDGGTLFHGGDEQHLQLQAAEQLHHGADAVAGHLAESFVQQHKTDAVLALLINLQQAGADGHIEGGLILAAGGVAADAGQIRLLAGDPVGHLDVVIQIGAVVHIVREGHAAGAALLPGAGVLVHVRHDLFHQLVHLTLISRVGGGGKVVQRVALGHLLVALVHDDLIERSQLRVTAGLQLKAVDFFAVGQLFHHLVQLPELPPGIEDVVLHAEEDVLAEAVLAVALGLLQTGGVAFQVDAHKALVLGTVLVQPRQTQRVITDVVLVVGLLGGFQRAGEVGRQGIVQPGLCLFGGLCGGCGLVGRSKGLHPGAGQRLQQRMGRKELPGRVGALLCRLPGLFLFCADCGHVMYQQRYQTDKRKQDCYICGSYKKRTADCTAHFIRTDLLTAGVLDNLRKVTAYAQKHEARFVKLLIQQNEMGGKRKLAAAAKQLEQVQSRIAELSRYIKRLYEDNVNGKISDERFMEMSADYEAEQRELKDRAAALQGELDKAQEATVNAEKFMSVVRKYLSIEELTHTLLREMVEKIVVYECEYDENEVRRQRIDIYYSFVGKIDLPEE